MSSSSRFTRSRGDVPTKRAQAARRALDSSSSGRQRRATDAVINQWLFEQTGRRGPVIAGAAAREQA